MAPEPTTGRTAPSAALALASGRSRRSRLARQPAAARPGFGFFPGA
ncbi:hypothetical protein [Halosimplex halobium]